MVTASVIVEWYNMTYAELNRATRMLAELTSQAPSLYSSDERAPVRLAKPLDLVIERLQREGVAMWHAEIPVRRIRHLMDQYTL